MIQLHSANHFLS